MDKKYILNRQGKDFVLYEGLLNEAHQQGLKRISTTLLQIPHQDNGNIAIAQAEVETDKGIYSGIGDASAANVNKMILPHLIRMSETRAKARALRDAVNIGATAFEELGDNDTDATDHVRDSSDAGDPFAVPGDVTNGTPNVRVWLNSAINQLAERDHISGPTVALRGMHVLGFAGSYTALDEEHSKALTKWAVAELKKPADEPANQGSSF